MVMSIFLSSIINYNVLGEENGIRVETAYTDVDENSPYYNPKYGEYLNEIKDLPEEEYNKQILKAPPKYIYNETESASQNERKVSAFAAYGLSTYNSMTNWGLKNEDQGNPYIADSGWAFGANDALEAYIKENKLADDCEFSEQHLRFAVSKDNLSSEYSNYGVYGGGTATGVFDDAAAYWTRADLNGPVAEETLGYNANTVENTDTLLKCKKENFNVTDTINISPIDWNADANTINSRVNLIKSLVMEYGALYIAYDHYDGAFDKNFNCYNNNYSYEISDGKECANGVVIVGWDDNYSAGNFGESKPSMNGAFLVKANRLVDTGEYTNPKLFGTYYLSYNMTPYFYDYGAVSGVKYNVTNKYTYEYDKRRHKGVSYSCSTSAGNVYANKYTNDTGQKQIIKSITTYCEVPGSSFKVYISKDGTMGNLQEVKLLGQDKGDCYYSQYMGYMTLELDEEVIVEGDFVVAIEVTNSKGIKESIPQEVSPIVNTSIKNRCFAASSIASIKGGTYIDCGSNNNIIKVHIDEPDREWNFNDEKFDPVSGKLVTQETTIDGLTFYPGIGVSRDKVDTTDTVIKGVRFKSYIQMDRNTDYKKRALSFYLNGPSDIYVAAKSNSPAENRRLALYVESTGITEYKVVTEKNGYHIKYRGEAGKAYLYSADTNIRIYALAVNDYRPNKYNYLDEERVWDFSDTTQYGTITENKNIDGLNIYATPEKTMSITYNGVITPEGYQYYNALCFEGSGSNDYRSVSFNAEPNSYIYIAAKIPTAGETRQLIVTNKYCCDLESDMESSYIDVDSNTRVYRIIYTGVGEEIFIRSADKQIRVYQIAVAKMSEKIIDDTYYSFENHEVGTSITSFSSDEFYVSSTYIPATIVSEPGNGYTKAISLYTENFKKAGKIYFPITDCRGIDNNRRSHKIKIVAKGNGTKLNIGNKYGYVYKSFDLTDSVQEYTYEYTDGAEILYLFGYNSSSNLKIYSVSTSDINYDHASGENSVNLSVKKGEEYKYHFTCENIPALDIYYYNIYYNTSLLEIESITFHEDIEGCIDESDVEYKSGGASFVLDNCKNRDWTGTIATVTFKGIADGNTYVSFSTDRRYN